MALKSVITPILGNNYYHIFNRGNNNQRIFFNETNYNCFLKLYKKLLGNCCETLAYCLISNHFHLLIKTNKTIRYEKDSQEIVLTDVEEVGYYISEQFRRLFLNYAQIVKSQEEIKGSIFTKPFRRLLIEREDYLEYLIFYIHYNPVKHSVQDNFKSYKYSSYKCITSTKNTGVSRDHVLELFGSLNDFIEYHDYCWEEKFKLIIE
jgi:REP element-mobilizing transposase RayT